MGHCCEYHITEYQMICLSSTDIVMTLLVVNMVVIIELLPHLRVVGATSRDPGHQLHMTSCNNMDNINIEYGRNDNRLPLFQGC